MEILDSDMDVIASTLETLYFKSQAEDILDNYRKLNVRQTASPLTKAVEAAYEKAKAYAEKKEDDVSE